MKDRCVLLERAREVARSRGYNPNDMGCRFLGASCDGGTQSEECLHLNGEGSLNFTYTPTNGGHPFNSAEAFERRLRQTAEIRQVGI